MGLLSQLPLPPKGKTGWPWTSESRDSETKFADEREWPRISIVTPSFNQGRYIEETVRSVLLQNYPRLEYIVMDGGSSDNTVDILKKYEPWISFWVSESDNGQSHAINKGMLRSDGDILCWINSDDWLKPGALNTVARRLGIDQPAWLIGASEVTTVEGRKKYIKYLDGDVTEKTFRHWNLDWIPQQSTFWNRRILDMSGLVDESLHYAMDVDFLYRLYRSTKPTLCDDILACYRIHHDAKTRNQSEKSILETAEWIVRNLLMAKEDHEAEIVEYVFESIILQKKFNRVRRHPVLGRVLSFWRQFINKNISF